MNILDWIKAWFLLPSGTNKLDTFYANDIQIVITLNMGLSFITAITGEIYTEITATTPLETEYSLNVKTALTYYLEYDMCLKSKSSSGGSSNTNSDKITIKDLSHTVIKETKSGTGSSSASTSIKCDDWLQKIRDLFAENSDVGGIIFNDVLAE